MKKIGIDARLIKQTGVGVYIQNLLFQLSNLPSDDITYIIFARSKDLESIPHSPKFLVKIADHKWHSFAEQIGFYSQLMGEKLDLMHFTYFSYPVRYTRRFVMTIHDLIPLHFKTGQASTHNIISYSIKHKAYEYVIKSSVENATKIITPTNAVREDIKKTFGNINPDKIEVTYEGIREDIMKTPAHDDLKNKLSKPFFLYVGNFYPHKNIDRLLKAFSQFSENFDLVLVGPNDFFAKKLPVNDGVKLLTNIETQDLVYLYKNAEALIHPSLHEGFGLPLLEATYFNLPIIASNIDVFKEILGDSYISFDPQSSANISEKIGQFINDKLSANFASKEDIITRFSFRKMTEQTLNIYQSLL